MSSLHFVWLMVELGNKKMKRRFFYLFYKQDYYLVVWHERN